MGPKGGDPQPDLAHHLRFAPTALLQQKVPLVIVGEQVSGAVDEPTDLVAVQAGQLLGRIGGERQAELAALLGVQEHRIGVVGADDHQFRCPDAGYDVGKRDVAGLRHRPRIEGRDLRHVVVGGADEPSGVGGVRDEHVVAVHAGGLEPLPVVVEVLAYGAHERDVTAEQADGVRHVACDAAAVHHQIVDQEAQRNLLQVIGQQLLGKPAGKTHEMVGRNGSGHRNGHETSPFIN